MDVPAKIRLLHHVRRVFPEWATERQALVIEHAFDPELSEAARAKNWDAEQAIAQRRDFEASEYWHRLAELRSHKLVRRARKLHLPVDGVKWVTGNYANRYLDSASEEQLFRAIREEERKNWEFRIKVIGALTGLIGTLIGLVSVWKHK